MDGYAKKIYSQFFTKTFTGAASRWDSYVKLPFAPSYFQVRQCNIYDNPTGASRTGSNYVYVLNSDFGLIGVQDNSAIAVINQNSQSQNSQEAPVIYCKKTSIQDGNMTFWLTTPTGTLGWPSNADSIDTPLITFMISFYE